MAGGGSVPANRCLIGEVDPAVSYPSWFFPLHFSREAMALLSGLLHPNPDSRMSVHDALSHVWVTTTSLEGESTAFLCR